MKQAGLTLQERHLVILLKWWVVLFAAAAAGFAFCPAKIISGINVIGSVFFNWSVPLLPEPAEHFWQVLAVSLVVLLTAISYQAQHDIRQNLSYVPLIILSKVITTVGFLAALIFDGHYFAYLVGAIIDGIIFVITWFCYSRTTTSRAL